MNTYHKEILAEIKNIAKPLPTRINLNHYLRSSHLLYSASVPECRRIAKAWAKEHADISENEFFDLLDSLFSGKSHEEKTMPSKLLDWFPKFRNLVTSQMIDQWLTHLEGWAEVDSLCQGTFPAEQFLSHWNQWKKALMDFSMDTNIHKRRASIVLLTGPVRQSDDARLSELAFVNINQLIHEKNILITKALSWLLRNLIKYHRKNVVDYIKINKEILPTIVFREVHRKLVTGKK